MPVRISVNVSALCRVQVVALLQEMGLEAHDVRPLRKAGITGAELLLLDEDQLMELLSLPKPKARRLRRLQVSCHSLLRSICLLCYCG